LSWTIIDSYPYSLILPVLYLAVWLPFDPQSPTNTRTFPSIEIEIQFGGIATMMKMLPLILVVALAGAIPAFAQEGGWIGVSIADQTDRGVLIRSVEPNSPAMTSFCSMESRKLSALCNSRGWLMKLQ
jgi:hypothetical protein